MTENETIEKKRKRLIFRSWHRGTREMCLIMGPFADKCVPDLSETGLNQYEEILGYEDLDLYSWLTGQVDPPAKALNDVFEKLLSHKVSR